MKIDISTGAPSAAVYTLPCRVDRVAEFLLLMEQGRRIEQRCDALMGEILADEDLTPECAAVVQTYLRGELSYRLPKSGLRGTRVPGGGFLFKGGDLA